jgi:2-polyprenyl-3-methyl-5-hydroxy-6-metoxy-1,4-benzoquinol methylase
MVFPKRNGLPVRSRRSSNRAVDLPSSTGIAGREETTVLGQPRGPGTNLRMEPEDVAAAVDLAGLKRVRVVELLPYHYAAILEKGWHSRRTAWERTTQINQHETRSRKDKSGRPIVSDHQRNFGHRQPRALLTEGTVEEAFQKDLSHLAWDEVYARQAARAGLVEEWLDALKVETGDRVLEVGPGPGYVSLVLADRTGPAGFVYAIDRSADALAYLERLQKERRVWHIRRLVADAATLGTAGLCADSALITMVLHHAEDPAGILRTWNGALALVAEFHPASRDRRGLTA